MPGLLPLQQYMLRGRDYDTVQRAVTILAQQCMDKQGFHIQLPPPVPAAGSMVDISVRRYGAPNTLGDAQKYGYQVPPEDTPAPTAADQAFDRSVTPAERKALVGATLAGANAPYRNGCVGDADRHLMGSSSAIQVDGLADPLLIRQVNDDPRAVESLTEEADLKKFARCMSAAGYPDVTGPLQLPRQFDNAGTFTTTVSKAQISAAVTQFDCRQSSGVEAAMRAAEVVFQLKAIDANPVAFAQVKAELAAVVRRATTIVAGG